MRRHLLNSVAEIKTEAEQNFGTKFKSIEDAFIDAYENGEFHEHGPDGRWQSLGANLTDEMIAECVPTVLRPLVNHARGNKEEVKQLMEFHEEMAKWLDKRLTNTATLFRAMRNTRDFIVADIERIPEAKDWLIEVLRFLSLIQMALESRMGIAIYHSEDEYENLIKKLSQQT